MTRTGERTSQAGVAGLVLVLGCLDFLGLAGDPAANARHGRGTGGRISRPGTALALIVPTDEELLIARDAARLIATVAAAGRDR